MGFLPVSKNITGEIRRFIESPGFDLDTAPESDPAWPKISIVTPSLNQAAFLERTICSIHNQGYPNLEHIIIDGGSTDGSVDIIRKYEKRLAYWHSSPDKGQSDAINTGVEHATGTYMAWINSDDLLLPGALSNMVKAFMDNPETDLVYGDQVEIDENDFVIKRLYTIDFDMNDFIYEVNIIVHQQSALWKTDFFKHTGGLKPYRYAMDYELFYRMKTNGARFRRIPGFLSAFRVHSKGLTGSGQLSRNRGKEVDAVFKDLTGHDRSVIDRFVLLYYYKAKRFAHCPQALLAAAENRLWQLWKKVKG